MPAADYGIMHCDHVMLSVERLEDAATAFQRLGFHCTISNFEKRLGTPTAKAIDDHLPFRNGHMKMRSEAYPMSYLEIMEVRDRFNAPEQMEFVRDTSGVASMVFRVEDEERFSRAMNADGNTVYPSFRTLGEDALSEQSKKLMPDISAFLLFAQYVLCPIVPKYGLSPYMWNAYHIKADYDEYSTGFMADAQEHENGAAGVTGTIGISIDPQADAKKMAAQLGGDVVLADDGSHLLKHTQFTIQFVDRGNFSSVYPGIEINQFRQGSHMIGVSILCENLDKARELFTRQGVAHVDTDEELWVQPLEACGTMMRFHAH